jgi:hypothetical protein
MVDQNDRELLRMVGEGMVLGMSPQTNLGASLGSFAANKGEIIASLAEGAEAYTDGLETVRELNSGIWMNSPMSEKKLYVVLCPGDTPAGPVTDLIEEMKPYLLEAHGANFLQNKAKKPQNK